MTNFSEMRLQLPSAIDIKNLDVARILEINVDDLEETMQFQPTLYCAVGMLARDAERQLSDAKALIDLLECGVKRDLYIRGRMEQRRIVKEEIAAECGVLPAYQAAEEKVRSLTYAASVLCTLEESFRQRFGMVQQIAKRRSNELSQLGQTP